MYGLDSSGMFAHHVSVQRSSNASSAGQLAWLSDMPVVPMSSQSHSRSARSANALRFGAAISPSTSWAASAQSIDSASALAQNGANEPNVTRLFGGSKSRDTSISDCTA